MAKININSIEGYADMTAEEKLAALEAYEFETPDTETPELSKYKKIVSERNSEINKLKDELKSKRTADEQAAIEREEKQKAMELELDSLRKEKKISKLTTDFMSIGFNKEMAEKTAIAKVDGDDDTVFANLKSLTENITKSAMANAMDEQGGLSSGSGLTQKVYTADDLNKMTPAEINANWDAIKGNLK